MRAATYLRQSKGDPEGIDRQRERTQQLIDLREWELVEEFADDDVSASKRRGDGTEWARLLTELESGRVEVVVATKLDRLLRTVGDLGTLVDLGAKVVTVDGEIDLTSAFGEFQATLGAGLARFEVRRKSERQQDANAKRARSGKWVGGRRPFGFEADGVTVRPEEAAAIRDGFRDYLGGANLSDVARDWNARGLTTGQGGTWERTAVRAVLTNPRYVGRVRYNGEIITKDGVPVVAEWPQLIDADTWEAVQQLVGGARGRVTRARALLTGVAVCGVEGCGATVHGGGNARKDVRGYRCSAALGHFSRMAEPIEDYVDRIVAARLNRPDAAQLAHAADASPEDQAALEALRARRDGLGVAFADGDLTREQVRSATERLNGQIAALESRMADAARSRILADLIGAGDRYFDLPVERRRQVIDTLMQVRILPPGRGTRTFRPESVEITWR